MRAFLVLVISARLASAKLNVGEWTAVTPPKGSGTGCAHKMDEWSFMVKKGTVNKIVFEFEGGGCCFSAITCALPQYTQSVNKETELFTLNSGRGIHSESDKENPVLGWHHVYIPYCTGDAHSGNRTADYKIFKINHVGFANAMYAVKYAMQHVLAPEDTEATFTTGISAGSVGTYIWAPWIISMYDEANVMANGAAATQIQHSQMGDSYVPLFGVLGLKDGMVNWGQEANYLKVPGLKFSPIDKFLSARQAVTYANYFKSRGVFFSSYTSNEDATQTAFYTDEGCVTCDWHQDMREVLPMLRNNASNYGYFIGPGSSHGRTDSGHMYTTEAQGVKLSDWMKDIVTNGQKVSHQTVDCKPHC